MKPEVSGSLKHLGYDWYEQTPKQMGEIITKFLQKVDAESYLMDVYTTGDNMYRNIHIEWDDIFVRRILDIRFNAVNYNGMNIEYGQKKLEKRRK